MAALPPPSALDHVVHRRDPVRRRPRDLLLLSRARAARELLTNFSSVRVTSAGRSCLGHRHSAGGPRHTLTAACSTGVRLVQGDWGTWDYRYPRGLSRPRDIHDADRELPTRRAPGRATARQEPGRGRRPRADRSDERARAGARHLRSSIREAVPDDHGPQPVAQPAASREPLRAVVRPDDVRAARPMSPDPNEPEHLRRRHRTRCASHMQTLSKREPRADPPCATSNDSTTPASESDSGISAADRAAAGRTAPREQLRTACFDAGPETHQHTRVPHDPGSTRAATCAAHSPRRIAARVTLHLEDVRRLPTRRTRSSTDLYGADPEPRTLPRHQPGD